MSSMHDKVRDELILDAAAGGELPITQIDYYVKQQLPQASSAEIQCETLATIQRLADEELVVLGAMSGEDGRWEAWDEPLEQSLRRISSVYETEYDDPAAWVFSAWITLTDKGKRLASALENAASDAAGPT